MWLALQTQPLISLQANAKTTWYVPPALSTAQPPKNVKAWSAVRINPFLTHRKGRARPVGPVLFSTLPLKFVKLAAKRPYRAFVLKKRLIGTLVNWYASSAPTGSSKTQPRRSAGQLPAISVLLPFLGMTWQSKAEVMMG